ncbi:translocation/assembly module TamB domain-containing protein [Synechococcus sp. A10-1-5-9]|uniref:translocation/assembly module TamB domain-containing protein n=1 Tax=Synechococcus sp. A10-1-5-9 TaxID=3392295 RepID=UPI0039E9DB26
MLGSGSGGRTKSVLFTGLGAVLIGGAVVWVAADRIVSAVFERLRPDLEEQVGKPLGHPVSIGSFQGLSLRGITVGPIKVQRGRRDQSTASVQQLTIGFNPLASLQRLRPVVTVGVKGALLDLRRNPQGAYWVPGPLPKGGKPPRLDLDVRLTDLARLQVAPAGLALRAAGWTSVRLDENRADVSLQVALPDRGRITLKGRGRWIRPELQLSTRLERIRLERYQGLLPAKLPVQLRGQLGGDLRLGWRQGQANCSGGISLVDVEVSGQPLDQPLRSKRLKISCRGNALTIPTSEWAYGTYRADLGGQVRLNRAFDLRGGFRELGQDRSVAFRVLGDWYRPKVELKGRWALPETVALDEPLQLAVQLGADWRNSKAWTAQLDRLDLQAPGVAVQARGMLHPQLDVTSQQLTLAGPAWKRLPLVPEFLGAKAPLQGLLKLRGETAKPVISLDLAQASNPLLEAWSLRAGWSSETGLLLIKDFRSPDLQADARLPLELGAEGLKIGDLQADLRLDRYPLKRIGPLLGTPMDGSISASGRVSGPLQALRPDLNIAVNAPRAGVIRLAENWKGRFKGLAGGGGLLTMASVGAVVQGDLEASLGANWLPNRVLLTRRGGRMEMIGTPAAYRWTAEGLSIDGVELALPPKQRWEGLYGRLSGEGTLGLQPLAMDVDLSLSRPGLMGLQLRQILLSGRYQDRRYSFTGELLPPDTGQITLDAKGRLNGALDARVEARGLSARWLTNSALSLPQLNDERLVSMGTAQDLGTLLVNTFGGTLDGQLQALRDAREALLNATRTSRERDPLHLKDLRGQVDAVIDVKGPRLSRLDLDLKARGHLWIEGQDQDYALQVKPFIARIEGPIQGGEGSFSLEHLPFSLLALVAPVPPALQGAVGLTGRYKLGGASPELSTDLKLEDAQIGDNPIALERGQVLFENGGLTLDLALKAEKAAQPVTVTGRIPLASDQPLDVRVVSLGDGLRFLTGFTGGMVSWTKGDADLRLLLSGPLSAPEANGYVVLKNASFKAQDQALTQVNGSMVFDFDRLEVQSLTGRVGSGGRLKGSGSLALLSPAPEAKPLRLQLEKARIKLTIADVQVGADLTITGALVKPEVGGTLEVSDGSIRPTRSMLVRPKRREASGLLPTMSLQGGDGDAQIVSADALLEQQWNFQDPLVLLGPNIEADSSRSLKASLPNLPFLGFDNLRLRLGPKLRVEVQPLANFTTEGLLTLNGALDPSLQLRGVVQLLTGRVSIFTTTFNLDRRSPNVAVFTPSLGLIPYVDVAMTSRVSDSVTIGTGSNAVSSSVFDTNGLGNLGAGGQLRLIKVILTATGPADRLADAITLRSSPALPEAQLLGLIGGNSLAGLSNAGAGAALAAVLGQSLLSPVLGTLTDAFNQRLQFALYPTYVTPTVQNNQERTSGQVPPQLALVTDVGVALTDRFDFSVLAAPDRNDIPSQGTLSYQLNARTSVSASVDTQGTWQSQLQVFFRF